MSTSANGRFRFKLAYRNVGDDRGLAIHIHGPTPSAEDEEVLRFDCFEKQPHYHLAWSYRSDPFIPINSSEPFEWALRKLRSDLPTLLERAGALPMNEEELANLASTLTSIKTAAGALTRDA